MLVPELFNDSMFDDFFQDMGFPFYNDHDMRMAEKKLYGRRGKNLMKTDIKELMIEREAKEELAGENVDAKIRVVKDIHQGTKITISGDIMILNDKYTHCQYSKRDGEIVSSVW